MPGCIEGTFEIAIGVRLGRMSLGKASSAHCMHCMPICHWKSASVNSCCDHSRRATSTEQHSAVLGSNGEVGSRTLHPVFEQPARELSSFAFNCIGRSVCTIAIWQSQAELVDYVYNCLGAREA